MLRGVGVLGVLKVGSIIIILMLLAIGKAWLNHSE